MKIGEVLTSAEALCEQKQKDTHPVRLFLMDVCNLESYQLYAALEDDIAEDFLVKFNHNLSRYLDQNEPVQYIIGYEYFAGRNLIVKPGALIPRPETEELVYEVLFLIDEYFTVEQGYLELQVADVGTGSGAIAISVAADELRVKMYATDISSEALEVAQLNAQKLDLPLQVFQGDMLAPLIEQQVKLDILISNPPYIPNEENVQDIVKENEPHVALFGGLDGLDFYRSILTNAHKVLKAEYLVAFEIGWDQAESLVELAKHNFPDAKIWVKKDMQNKDRMLFISNKM